MIQDVFYTFVLAHLIVKFEPIGWVMDSLYPIFNRNGFTKFIFNIVNLALTCLKCSSLYVGFFIGGFWCGVITSFISYLYTQVASPLIDKIRFQ